MELQITGFLIGEDLSALGFVFIELLFASLLLGARGQDPVEAARAAVNSRPDQMTFQRLFDDVFDGDMERLREYCREDPTWAFVVDSLDEDDSAGWELLELLLTAARPGKTPVPSFVSDPAGVSSLLTCRTLLQSPFLKQ